MQHSNRDSNRFTFARVQVVIILGAFVLTAIGAFTAGYLTAHPAQDDRIKVFKEAFELTDEFYYAKPSDSERVYAAIQGMLSTLKDKYSVFLPPSSAAVDTT